MFLGCSEHCNAKFKSVENPVNKIGVKIMTIRKQYLKWSFRPTFKRQKQFCNGTIATENKNVE